METRNFQRMLINVLLSTAAFGVTAGAAFAGDDATIYGRSSESGAVGESVNSAVPEDVSNVYGRAPAVTPNAAVESSTLISIR